MEALAHCTLFRGMDAQEREELCRCLGTRRRKCRKGEAIFLRGETVECCCVVLRGQVQAESVSGSCSRACAAHEKLRRNLLQELAKKYWQQRRRCGWLEKNSLRARIAARLLYEAGAQQSEIFSLGCSREALAGELGVNRSALSRELSRMKNEGIIDVYRDSFRILDRERLKNAG